jgi:hypothetical protein
MDARKRNEISTRAREVGRSDAFRVRAWLQGILTTVQCSGGGDEERGDLDLTVLSTSGPTDVSSRQLLLVTHSYSDLKGLREGL